MLDTVPFNMHCYSLDWHPSDHVSFTDNAHLRKISPTSKIHVTAWLPTLPLVSSECQQLPDL
jgi:hypothetical protein